MVGFDFFFLLANRLPKRRNLKISEYFHDLLIVRAENWQAFFFLLSLATTPMMIINQLTRSRTKYNKNNNNNNNVDFYPKLAICFVSFRSVPTKLNGHTKWIYRITQHSYRMKKMEISNMIERSNKFQTKIITCTQYTLYVYLHKFIIHFFSYIIKFLGTLEHGFESIKSNCRCRMNSQTNRVNWKSMEWKFRFNQIENAMNDSKYSIIKHMGPLNAWKPLQCFLDIPFEMNKCKVNDICLCLGRKIEIHNCVAKIEIFKKDEKKRAMNILEQIYK